MPSTEAPRRPSTEAPPPTAIERVRLRRLVRGALVGVVAVQALAIGLLVSPPARAQFAVAVANFIEVTGGTGTLAGIDRTISRLFNTANGRLADLLRIAEEERRSGDNNADMTEDDLRQVTEVPLGFARVQQGDSRAVVMDDDGGVRYLTQMVPGTIPWDDYAGERRQSTDMALLTLRGGVQALHDFDRSIRDDSRLRELSRASRGASSDRALQQLQIETSLEVARQLHALRAQQALQTNLYAVTESHRLGLEARQFAEDTATDCDIIREAFGPLGPLFCNGGGGDGPSLPLP